MSGREEQWGWRFSLDFAPFSLLLVALALANRSGGWRLAVCLVCLSVVISAWGVWWGGALSW